MKPTKTYSANILNGFAIQAYRLFFGRIVPQTFLRDKIPEPQDRKAVNGSFTLEIVSHCWAYANMLSYQLSSFVNFPPSKLQLTVTVFYSEQDLKTKDTLNYFSQIKVKNVTWNFHSLPKEKLFRRAIGRNMAARSTSADWIWFTDCDIVFHNNCLDSLAESLQGERGILFYPQEEKISNMLSDMDPLLSHADTIRTVDIPVEKFSFYKRDKTRNKARGPFQIVHGDVARAIGYCDRLFMFQTQAKQWQKCYEDTAFRWLLGTQGEAKRIDNVFHIQHITKGRYSQSSLFSKLRSKIRILGK